MWGVAEPRSPAQIGLKLRRGGGGGVATQAVAQPVAVARKGALPGLSPRTRRTCGSGPEKPALKLGWLHGDPGYPRQTALGPGPRRRRPTPRVRGLPFPPPGQPLGQGTRFPSPRSWLPSSCQALASSTPRVEDPLPAPTLSARTLGAGPVLPSSRPPPTSRKGVLWDSCGGLRLCELGFLLEMS